MTADADPEARTRASIPDSAADGPTTKDTKVTKEEVEKEGAENGSRDVDSAPERSRRGIA